MGEAGAAGTGSHKPLLSNQGMEFARREILSSLLATAAVTALKQPA